MKQQTWYQWLKACKKDSTSPACHVAQFLGALTGQDHCALGAISACWDLYTRSDIAGQHSALQAISELLNALQLQCRPFARELIAFSMDWPDRERLWPLVSG